MGDGRHIFEHEGCPEIEDSQVPEQEVNNCPDFGTQLDLFPSTTTFVSATVTDPNAAHFDPVQNKIVVGPVSTRVFFQVAGQHPDLNRNGIDDAIDIDDGTSPDGNHDGVPDEVQQCLTQLSTLQSCELQESNLIRQRDFIVLQEQQLNACEAQGGDFACCPVPVQACAIGTSSLDLRDRVKVTANAASDNFTLGASALVGGNANVFGTALLRSNSRITGELDITGGLTQQTGSTIGGGVKRPGSAAQSVLPTNAVTAGTGTLIVDNGQTRTLNPGSYGDVTFRARSRVTMNSGTYNLASFTVEGPTTINLNVNNGPITINVKGNVMIFGGAAFATTDPTKVKLYSTGNNVTFQASNTFPGTVVAPFATVAVANFVNISGCLGGKTVSVDTDSQIKGSGFLSGGKQACDNSIATLEAKRIQLQQQIDQQTITCNLNEQAYRTCTGVPAPAAPLHTLSMTTEQQSTSLGTPSAGELGSSSSASCSVSIERAAGDTGNGTRAGLLGLLSLLAVWVRRQGARRRS